MKDALGRRIDYMRVSVTDRCNLRCKYCMPGDLPSIAHNDILRYEELLRLCGIAATLGIRTLKVTGGEPLVRKDCVDFIKDTKAIPGIENVTLTTNGILLESHVEALVALHLDGVNISLDSIDAGTYRKLTGRDEFRPVWKSLHKAVNAGLRVKINCVLLKGINEGELLSIARIAEQLPVDVRFIELMPTHFGERFERIFGREILVHLQSEYPDLVPDETKHGFGPARYFSSSRLKGGIGIIDAVSNHFCGSCNRVRLTSDGFLKLCLYHEEGLDLRAMLRSGAENSEIEAAMANAIYSKPAKHFFDSMIHGVNGINEMSRIGG